LFYDAVGKAVECVRSAEMIGQIEQELTALE
jgi:hypothetical protein